MQKETKFKALIIIITFLTFISVYGISQTIAEYFSIKTSIIYEEPVRIYNEVSREYEYNEEGVTVVGFYILFLSVMISYMVYKKMSEKIFDKDNDIELYTGWFFLLIGVTSAVILYYPISESNLPSIYKLLYPALIVYFSYSYFSNKYEKKIKKIVAQRKALWP